MILVDHLGGRFIGPGSFSASSAPLPLLIGRGGKGAPHQEPLPLPQRLEHQQSQTRRCRRRRRRRGGRRQGRGATAKTESPGGAMRRRPSFIHIPVMDNGRRGPFPLTEMSFGRGGVAPYTCTTAPSALQRAVEAARPTRPQTLPFCLP